MITSIPPSVGRPNNTGRPSLFLPTRGIVKPARPGAFCADCGKPFHWRSRQTQRQIFLRPHDQKAWARQRDALRSRQRSRETVRPLWREPSRWRRGGGAGRGFADAQSNILTMPAGPIILALPDGTIIDDSSPSPDCCCGCPPCYTPNASLTAICKCIPDRFLCVISGVDVNCTCYVCSSGAVFDHCLSDGSVDTSFCIDGVTPFPTPSVHTQHWNVLGPGCEPPAELQEEGFTASIFAAVGGFGSIVEAQCIIQSVPSGHRIFCGRLRNTDCEGPWVVTNVLPSCTFGLFYDAATNCGDEFLVETYIGHAGTATFYACAC